MLQRIVEFSSAVAANAISSPLNGEYAAEPGMDATEQRLENGGQGVHLCLRFDQRRLRQLQVDHQVEPPFDLVEERRLPA